MDDKQSVQTVKGKKAYRKLALGKAGDSTGVLSSVHHSSEKLITKEDKHKQKYKGIRKDFDKLLENYAREEKRLNFFKKKAPGGAGVGMISGAMSHQSSPRLLLQ